MPHELDDPDARIAVIELDGLNGLMTTKFWTLEEIDEGLDQEPEEPTGPDGEPVEPCEDCDA